MKRISLIIFFVGIFCSCSVEVEEKVFEPEMFGRWEWVKSTGGIDGRTETPASTGEQITIEFLIGTYKKYVDGKLSEEMTYKIDVGESMISGENSVIIIYQNGWKQSVEFENDNLILQDECSDCFRNEYTLE
jgi:hypothetical protein